MPRLTNLKKSEHILGGGLRPDGTHAEDIILRPGVSLDFSDADFKKHDGIALRAMIAAGDLALGEPPPAKKPAPPVSNEPARNADAEDEAAELLKNVSKSRK